MNTKVMFNQTPLIKNRIPKTHQRYYYISNQDCSSQCSCNIFLTRMLRLMAQNGLLLALILLALLSSALKNDGHTSVIPKLKQTLAVATIAGATLTTSQQAVQAKSLAATAISRSFENTQTVVRRSSTGQLSPGREWARQKRNAAIKEMENKKILTVSTDDSGNQFLVLPWVPGRAIPYKSLPLEQRLLTETFAGAIGEIAKDALLHPVDTLKVRRQAASKKKVAEDGDDSDEGRAGSPTVPGTGTVSVVTAVSPTGPLDVLKELYSGFPVVLSASLFQGGSFFLIKNAVINYLQNNVADLPSFVSSTVPIGFAVMGYWLFRTPAEVIKTNVQTGQTSSVAVAIREVRNSEKGFQSLWKYYFVMLWLDIPFQILNFILYGLVSEVVRNAGFESSILTRLFCGIFCGTISAGVTCPLDVCKTRIISRDKAQQGKLGTTSKPVPSLLADFDSNSDSNLDAISDSVEEPVHVIMNSNVPIELVTIFREEGLSALFLGLRQRLLYTGLANGIRLAAYGTSRMDLMMRSLDDL